jgi:hypothetical protein
VTRKAPAQTPVARRTDELDRRLLDTLAAHQGPAGICPGVPRLARLLGVHVSTIQRALLRLERAGRLKRIEVFETDDDLEWKRRLAAGFPGERPRRQTANSYVLLPGPGRSSSQRPAGQPPVARDSVRPLEGKEPADGGYQGSRDEDELTLRPTEPVEIPIEPPAALLLDHDPGPTEILDALGRGFGTVQVAQVWPNELAGPPIGFHKAVDRLDRATCWSEIDRCHPGHRCRRHTRRKSS